ncbi:MAG: Murein hydrolase activator EnvC precursor [Firmicutes bacterium ADurb.Bin182]|nr:MAG: Murein hydrolase activator EnvC precursor [Firmicutes bacterium ADurb.Bin182]
MIGFEEKENDSGYAAFKKRALILFALVLTAIAFVRFAYRSVFPAAGVPEGGPDTVVEIETPHMQAVQTDEQEQPSVARGAFAVTVNNEERAVLASREAAQNVLERILREQTGKIEKSSPGVIEYAGFLEHVSIVPVVIDNSTRILSEGEAYVALTRGDSVPSVKLVVSETMYEPIEPNPGPVIVNDGSLPENTRVISSLERSGVKSVTCKTVFLNGEEIIKKDRAETVLIEPVSHSIRVGTAKPGEKFDEKTFKDGGDLKFSEPVRGKVTTAYGLREGSMHLGIDYKPASPDVFAAESGKVVAVMERSGYGLLIDIDHGNGFVTRYANLQESAVQVGSFVSKGELIAKAGESGGERILHFELRADGGAVDPAVYIKDAE